MKTLGMVAAAVVSLGVFMILMPVCTLFQLLDGRLSDVEDGRWRMILPLLLLLASNSTFVCTNNEPYRMVPGDEAVISPDKSTEIHKINGEVIVLDPILCEINTF